MACKFIHIRNLEKYHPGYKDRKLIWGKILFNMVQGDPDCEMITNEVDWGRLIKFILLELQAQKPLPLDKDYLLKKGFNLKQRNIELTLQALYKFIEIKESNEIVTEPLQSCNVEESREDKSRKEEEERNKLIQVFVLEATQKLFGQLWDKYPNKDSRSKSEALFVSTVQNATDWINIEKALNNYLLMLSKETWRQPKSGQTWFRNWKDWVNYKPDDKQKPVLEEGKYAKSKNG